MKTINVFICALLCLLILSNANAQFVHPGLSLNKAELDKIKTQLNEASDNVRALAWNKMISTNCALLSYQANPREIVQADQSTSGNFGLDALAAFSHALQWYITGNQNNANKAIDILNGYSSILKSIINDSDPNTYRNQYKLIAAWAGATFCDAAEILRYSNSGWKDGDIAQFEGMMKNVFYPIVSQHSNENGNWEASQINTLLAIGVFCNDQTIFNMGKDWFLGNTRGAVGTYVYDDGECQETCRDAYHSAMGLGELVEAAEIAWKQGIDLYGALPDPSTGMPRLAMGLEYTAASVNGVDKTSRDCGLVAGSTSFSFQNQPMWEKAWNHYGNRMGRTNMPYTKLSAEVKIRPDGIAAWTGMYGFQTLTHANLSTSGIIAAPACGNTVPWTSNSFAAQNNTFTVEFDATPGSATIDGVVGLSNGYASAYSNFACGLQFNTGGTIKARNGGSFVAVNTLTYSAGITYHVKMVVDVNNHKYDVFVTPNGGSLVVIATGYSFRTEQAGITQLNNLAKVTTACSLAVSNFKLNNGPTSIDFLDNHRAIKIYPNPSKQNSNLTIDFGKNIDMAEIEIFDISGEQFLKQIVRNVSVTNLNTKKSLSSGIYLVRIKDGKNIYNKKIQIIN